MAYTDPIRPGFNRVTEVLKSMSDFANIPTATLDNARDRGIRVHEAIDEYIKCATISEKMEEQDKPYFDSFLLWYEGTTFTGQTKIIEYGETRLYDEKRFITGQFDGIWHRDNQKLLIDWKTSYAENKLVWPTQAAAYQQLIRTNKFCDCSTTACFLKLDKHGHVAREYLYEITEYHHAVFNWRLKEFGRSCCERLE